MTIDNLLHDFIFNLSGVGFGVPSQQGAAIPPMYAFFFYSILFLLARIFNNKYNRRVCTIREKRK